MKLDLSKNKDYPHFKRYMELYREYWSRIYEGIFINEQCLSTVHEIFGAIHRIVVVYMKSYLSMNKAYTHFKRYIELYKDLWLCLYEGIFIN